MQGVVAFNARLALVEVRLEGIVDGEVLVAALDRIKAQPMTVDPVGVIWDFHRADLSALDLRGMQQAWTARAAQTRPSIQRVAFVVRGEAEAVLMRLWAQGVHPRDGRERRVFDDLEEARAWVAAARPGDA